MYMHSTVIINGGIKRETLKSFFMQLSDLMFVIMNTCKLYLIGLD